jgi:hypothetical protein
VIKRQRELLAGQTKADLCILARSKEIKLPLRIQGQGSHDLLKDAIICKIIEKKYVDASVSHSAPQIDTENVIVHDNFCLIEISDQCGSLATRSELDTSQLGANSPFWVHVVRKFKSIGQDSDPNVEGIDFLDKVHFTDQFYDSHSVTINPGNHNLFSGTKLRSTWNKIKADYDLATISFQTLYS